MWVKKVLRTVSVKKAFPKDLNWFYKDFSDSPNYKEEGFLKRVIVKSSPLSAKFAFIAIFK
jgi:hypothetical protein